MNELGVLLEELVRVVNTHERALEIVADIESKTADCIRVCILLNAASLIMSFAALCMVVAR